MGFKPGYGEPVALSKLGMGSWEAPQLTWSVFLDYLAIVNIVMGFKKTISTSFLRI